MEDRRTAIIIAAYNAEATIASAIRSALSQPEAAEVCVVDDGSADGTCARVEDLAATTPRVTLIKLASNKGPSAARNAGVATTTAPWITILDADDYMLEGRLGALHDITSEADFVADALLRTTGAAPSFERQALHPKALEFSAFVLGNLGLHDAQLDLGYLKPMFRRAFVERHRLSYREDMRLGEDYEFYARALALGARFLVCEPAGYVSIEREGSLSRNHSEHDLQLLRDCDDGLAAIRALSPAEQRALARHWNSVDCRLQWRRLITAVKNKDAGAAFSAFRSPQASLYLAARLGEQAWLRGTGRFRRDTCAPNRAIPATAVRVRDV